jgi:hypothetical protein
MGGQPAPSVAWDLQVSSKTVHKWIARFRAQVGLDLMIEALGRVTLPDAICNRATS